MILRRVYFVQIYKVLKYLADISYILYLTIKDKCLIKLKSEMNETKLNIITDNNYNTIYLLCYVILYSKDSTLVGKEKLGKHTKGLLGLHNFWGLHITNTLTCS